MSTSVIRERVADTWTLYNGDCVEVVDALPDASIDYTIFSPPFANLYIYTASERDMGNCADDDEFFDHFRFLIPELFRVTVSGRCCSVHCKDLPKYFGRDGEAGLKDFPGRIIREFEECGWTFLSRVTIWKCPVTERERTNNNGLLHKTVCRDSSQLRMGMADYLLTFRKTPDGQLEGAKPIVRADGFTKWVGEPETDPRKSDKHPSKFARKRGKEAPSISIWRRYAEPVWWDIAQTDVLNAEIARDDRDEKHICPLQLGLIRRALNIWSDKNDVVLSPFAGVGSEGYVALQEGRRFIGVELKDSYYDIALSNLEKAAKAISQELLF
jgi:DNA modification methylase